MAWTILQKETCQECNQPLWVCRSDNNNLTFSVRKGTCYSKLALQNFQEQREKRKEKVKHGETIYTVPKMLNNERLPTRQEYLEQLEDD